MINAKDIWMVVQLGLTEREREGGEREGGEREGENEHCFEVIMLRE